MCGALQEIMAQNAGCQVLCVTHNVAFQQLCSSIIQASVLSPCAPRVAEQQRACTKHTYLSHDLHCFTLSEGCQLNSRSALVSEGLPNSLWGAEMGSCFHVIPIPRSAALYMYYTVAGSSLHNIDDTGINVLAVQLHCCIMLLQVSKDASGVTQVQSTTQ